MKTIYKIARTELRILFYSPIAWFLLVVFLIQCGITYFNMISSYARTQELGGMGLQFMAQLTERVFTGRGGLFNSVMEKLYLFIPLLTMGLISRETSSGTIKLLYSSPIQVRKIVLGKYLAMMIYSLLLVAIVSIFMILGMRNIVSPDGGILVTAAIGFYLLLCAYSAIGLFMSCLTTYQIVAAVCTFVMIGVLSYIGTLWQGIDFVRDLTYFLSFSGRAEKMLVGLLTTKDVIYFLVIIYMFLGLSIYKLRSGMESKPGIVKAGRYAGIVALALLIGYISSRPVLVGYLDATFNKSRTLTPNAQKIIKELGEEPLEVITYVNLLGNNSYMGLPEQRNADLARWEPYMRFKNNINIQYVQYYDSALDNSWLMRSYPGKTVKEIAEQYAKSSDFKLSKFKTPEEIRKIIDLRPELNRYVMQLNYKGKSTFLRIFDDQQVWPGETEVSAALKRLMQAKLPKIAFLTGDLERDINKMGDKDYRVLTNLSTFRNSFVNQGFNVDTVSLETQDIPADISTLVIADPKIELSAVTMDKLQKYIDKGGNLLIAGEPNKQAMLNPLLQQLGVQLTDGIIIQESKDYSPDLVRPYITSMAGAFSKRLAKSAEDSAQVSMPRVVGLSYTNGGAYTIKPLLMTDAKLTWNRKQKLDLEMMTNANASGGDASVQGGMAASGTAPVQVTGNVAAPPANHRRHERHDTSSSVANGMPADVKKRMDSIRTVMAAVMNGPGTQEEKQKKMADVMASVRRNAPRPTARPKLVANPEVTDDASPGGSGITMTVGGGGMMAASSDREGRRSAAAGTVTFSAADGDQRGPIPVTLSLTRQVNGKEQRIIVSGDADFMSNNELKRQGNANFIFSTALFSWLSYGEFPIDTSRPESKDNRVTVSSDTVDMLKLIFLWILPGVLIALAAILLIRRKRK